MNRLMNRLKSREFTMALAFFGLYLISTGIFWFAFTYLGTKSEKKERTASNTNSNLRVDLSLPKTEVCPINGEMFTKAERDIWLERRPIAAIIENHADSRPQSGLSYADVVYEAVAEGGITRFLAIFYCNAVAQEVKIAPIRSARVYFVDWASEYQTPVFVHVGGANSICSNCPGGIKPAGQVAKEVDAFKLLDKLGWRGAKGNAFDGGTNVGVPLIVRDQYRLGKKSAWEHSVVGSVDNISKEAQIRGYGYEDEDGIAWNKGFLAWRFIDEKPLLQPTVNNISFEFWSNKPDYDVSWNYDREKNTYLRSNGGNPHTDNENNRQITAKNVLIQFVNEKGPVDKEGHMYYQTLGKGKILLFANGGVVEGTWEKSFGGRTKFYDEKGAEISFVRGIVWVEVIPSGNKITYGV